MKIVKTLQTCMNLFFFIISFDMQEKGEIFRISFKRDLVPILVDLFKNYYPPNFGSKLTWQVVVMIFVHLAIINLIYEF
jgi:hypothetical protein